LVSYFNHYLAREAISHFSLEKVVPITHEQTIICGKTHLDGTTHEQKIICRSRGGLSANGREEKTASNDKVYESCQISVEFGTQRKKLSSV